MICKLLCPHAGQLLVATLRWDVFDWKRDIVQLEQEIRAYLGINDADREEIGVVAVDALRRQADL